MALSVAWLPGEGIRSLSLSVADEHLIRMWPGTSEEPEPLLEWTACGPSNP